MSRAKHPRLPRNRMSILPSAVTEPGTNRVAAAPSALASVLVIDDEEIVGNTLAALLKADGFDAVTARSGQEGVEIMSGRQFDVTIVDLLMPGIDGIQTIAALKEIDPDVEAIILTGHVTVDSTIAALRQGACDFLQKPMGLAQLRPALLRALEKRRGEAARREARTRTVIDTAREAIVLFDKEGVVREFNPSAEHIFGWSREQVVGRNLADFAIPTRLLGVFKKHLETAYREGKAPLKGCLEVYALRQNGEEFPFEISTALIETPQGKLLSTFGRDITERKQVEQALANERDLLHALMDNLPDYLYFKDLESRFLRTNMAHSKALGLSDPAQAIGKTDFDFFPREDAKNYYEDEKQVLQTGQPLTGRLESVRQPDGQLRWCSTTKVPIRDDQGRVTGLVGITRDITEQKRAEEELRLTHFSMEHASDSIFWMNPQGRIVYVNEAACRTLGRSRQELLSLSIPDIDPNFSPGDWGAAWEKVKALGSMTLETCHQAKQGRVFPVEITSNYLEFGGNEYSFAFARDITERKRTEEELRQSNEMVRLLLDSIPEAVYGIDVQGKCTFCNPSCLQLLGYQKDTDVLGKDMHALLHHTRQDGRPYPVEECHIYEAIRRGRGTHIDDEVLWRRDGSNFPAEYWSRPIHRHRNVIGTVVTFVDITERKRAEAALQDSEQRYRLLFSQMLVGFALLEVICDEKGIPIDHRYLEINAAFEKHTGLAREGVVGRTIREVLPAIEPFWIDTYGKVATTGESVHFESYAQPVQRWFEVTAFRLRPGRVAVTFADITQRKQAEQQTRLQTAALESAANGIAIADREGCILWVNPAFTRLTGYSAAEVLGQTMRILNSGEQGADFYRNLWQTILGGKVWKGELVNRRKDGTLYTDDSTITPVRDASGTLTHFVAIKQDATERRRAEQALQERTVYLDTLFELSPVGIVVLDTAGCIQMSNSMFEKLFLYSREEIFGAKLDDVIVPTELVSEARTLTALCLGGGGAQATSRRRRKDGTLLDTEIYGVPLVIDGELRGYLGLYQDITERKRAEADLIQYAEDLEVSKAAQEKHAQELARLVEELARERDLLGTLMDNLPDYIYYKDRQGGFVRINPAHAKVLGLNDPRQAVGKTDFDFFPEEDAKGYFSDEQQVIETGRSLIGRIEKVRQPEGQYCWCMTSTVPIRDIQGQVTGLVGIARDITERMQAEETLRASEERYRELFENASDIVYTTGLDTRLTSLNRVGRKILGYSAEEATQLTLEQLVTPKHRELIKLSRKRLLAGVSDIGIEVEVTTKDGRRVLLEVSPRLIYKDGKPVGVQGIARDITGRDAAELELRHAQKLESVGRLASGIAHEINTPIQFVGDNTRFLQDSFGGLQTLLTKYQELRDAVDSGAVSPELLKEVRDAEEGSDCVYLLEEIPKALTQTLDGVTRVATIVRAMKEFAHPESKELAAADLNRALLSTLTVARNELKYVADVETEFGELPLVVCNIGDMNQVFLNLLVNAAHAIGESTKGTGQKGQIRVRTVSEGDAVLVSISDTGCGIPEANRTKVFDPFFTTKEVGRGTGQGLAIARSVVVDRHKGALTFESEVGKGTTFYIRLPIDPGDCSKEAAP